MEPKLELVDGEAVAVRMYGQGFGDCFLLAFPRVAIDGTENRKDPVYVVIDCGVFLQTPGEKGRMQRVVRSIEEATRGHVDLLVATHEHYDHLSGFNTAAAEWKRIAVDQIWLAWTEDAKNKFTQTYDEEWKASLTALRGLAALVDDEMTVWDAAPLAFGLSSFAVDNPFRPPAELSKGPDAVLDDFSKNPAKRFRDGSGTQRTYCSPAEVHKVPNTKIDTFVLGPPTSPAFLGVAESHEELYELEAQYRGALGIADDEKNRSERDIRFQAVARAVNGTRAELEGITSAIRSRLPASESDDGRPIRDDAPFSARFSIPYAEAKKREFFQANYFNKEEKRRIEREWLSSANALALQIDGLVNNTSLALAFRLPNGGYLLFPGDAQAGNWLSWHEIQPASWKYPGSSEVVKDPPTAADILASTKIYKVGHHGSHNATLSRLGLELMPPGVIALFPTSKHHPQARFNWKIPQNSIVRRMVEKHCRIIFPHADKDSVTDPAFLSQIENSADHLPAMGSGEKQEGPVPLWRQIRL